MPPIFGRYPVPLRTQALFHALAIYAEDITSSQSLATEDGYTRALTLLQSMRGWLFILVGRNWSIDEEEALRSGFGLDDLIGRGPLPLHARPSFPFDRAMYGTILFTEMVARLLETMRAIAVPPYEWEPLLLQHALDVTRANTVEELRGMDSNLRRGRERLIAYERRRDMYWRIGLKAVQRIEEM